MGYISINSRLFRDLTDEEEREFREYARKNKPKDMAMWETYHPVCREEWVKQGIGTGE